MGMYFTVPLRSVCTNLPFIPECLQAIDKSFPGFAHHFPGLLITTAGDLWRRGRRGRRRWGRAIWRVRVSYQGWQGQDCHKAFRFTPVTLRWFTLHHHAILWDFCCALHAVSCECHWVVLGSYFYSMRLKGLLSLREDWYTCAKSLVGCELKPPSPEPWFFSDPLCPCRWHRLCDGFELIGAADKLCWFTVEIKANQQLWVVICSCPHVLTDVQGLETVPGYPHTSPPFLFHFGTHLEFKWSVWCPFWQVWTKKNECYILK